MKEKLFLNFHHVLPGLRIPGAAPLLHRKYPRGAPCPLPMVNSGLFHSCCKRGRPAMRNRGMAHVIVPLTRSVGSSGETVETEEEDEVVARIAIV